MAGSSLRGVALDGSEAVDCSGGFVWPGFFDTHVHVTIT
jgi:predicted amidohydrolase YtcJ